MSEYKPSPCSAPVPAALNDGELCALVRRGDCAASEELCRRNARLVCAFADRAARRCPASDREDLRQAGFMGLLRAARLYREDRGARLSTYATYYIRRAILHEALQDSRMGAMLVRKTDGSENGDAMENVPDLLTPSPEEEAERRVLPPGLKRAMDRVLTERERTVLLRRFGFSGEAVTASGLARELGVSRQSVQSTEIRALKKLRRAVSAH